MALTSTQRIVLKADIIAKQAVGQPLFGVTDEQAIANFYNAASLFIVWKSTVSIEASGQAFNGAEWAAMTGANHTRLQTVAQYMASYSPALADIRAMFNDIWSGAGGVLTRASLLALWKRAALRVEQLFATGTGTDVSPGVLVAEGKTTAQEVANAIAGL